MTKWDQTLFKGYEFGIQRKECWNPKSQGGWSLEIRWLLVTQKLMKRILTTEIQRNQISLDRFPEKSCKEVSGFYLKNMVMLPSFFWSKTIKTWQLGSNSVVVESFEWNWKWKKYYTCFKWLWWCDMFKNGLLMELKQPKGRVKQTDMNISKYSRDKVVAATILRKFDSPHDNRISGIGLLELTWLIVTVAYHLTLYEQSSFNTIVQNKGFSFLHRVLIPPISRLAFSSADFYGVQISLKLALILLEGKQWIKYMNNQAQEF